MEKDLQNQKLIQSVLFKNGISKLKAYALLSSLNLKKIGPFRQTRGYLRAGIIKPDHANFLYVLMQIPDRPYDFIIQHPK